MTDRTENDRPDEGRDTLSVARPEWMPADRWLKIEHQARERIMQLIDDQRDSVAIAEIVARAPERGCSELPWCVMGTSGEHLEYHAGACVDLADDWYCWLVEERTATYPTIRFELEV